MKKTTLATLLKALGDLLRQLAEDETPKPKLKAPPVPLVSTSGWVLTQNLHTGETRVNGEPAFFVPREYVRHEDGSYWLPWSTWHR
jgi:hypothetical protein